MLTMIYRAGMYRFNSNALSPDGALEILWGRLECQWS
jgi:hypothetical protein